jgi:hypothetical protein
LRTAAEARGITARGEALEKNERVIALTIAQRWNGQPPQTILGEKSALPFFNVGSNPSFASVPAAEQQTPKQ